MQTTWPKRLRIMRAELGRLAKLFSHHLLEASPSIWFGVCLLALTNDRSEWAQLSLNLLSMLSSASVIFVLAAGKLAKLNFALPECIEKHDWNPKSQSSI